MVFYPKCIIAVNPTLHDYGIPNFRQLQEGFLSQPISATVHINSYSEADTFNCTLRWEDFPFDPRLIRNALVIISIFDLKKLDNITDFKLKQVRDNSIFVGNVDQYSVKLDSAVREVHIEGRDFTSIFLETKFDNANLEDEASKRTRKIDLNRSLVKILEDLKSNVPGAESIAIEPAEGITLPTNVAVASPGFSLVSGQTSTDGKFTYVQKHENYWDVIQNICQSVGVIAYIKKDKLVLTNSRILFHGESFSTKEPIPFIYGENVSSLSFRRNLGRKKRFNIIMKSWNTKTNTPFKVSIPRDATAQWSKETNIPKAVQKIQTLDAQGNQITKDAPGYLFSYHNKTREQMVEIGQGIFEEIARQQIEGEMETKEMVVNNQNGVEIDLTKISVGTPLLLEIVQKDIQYISRKTIDGDPVSDGKRMNYLISRGYSVETASVLIEAVAQTSGKIRPVFYIRSADIMIGQDGFSLRIGFVNYIELGELQAGKVVSG